MQRAGMPEELSQKLLDKTEKNLYDGIQTWEIYQNIQDELSKKNTYYKARYSLKQAIMMLGPTGYPFEDFIAKVLEAEGFTASVRQVLPGRCVRHEIDVVAEKDERRIMIEAKFHNSPGARSDLHVAMYTKARFDDVKLKNNLNHCMLITNTKASIDAVSYATCMGYQVVSWDYPKGQSLREVIERHRLYPVTALTSISHQAKLALLSDHTVLIKDIQENPGLLNTVHISREEKQSIRQEVSSLLNPAAP